MDPKNLVVIIAVAFIIAISAGFVLASRHQYPESQHQSDRSSSFPAITSAPSVTSISTTSLMQSPVVPRDQSTSPITAEQARALARETFPEFDPDKVNITYNPGDQSSQSSFEFDLFRNDERLGQGGLDPKTGSLIWYAIPVKRFGRPAEPLITIDSARNTSRGEIGKRNGAVSLRLSEERYDSLGMPDSGVAGLYVFVYDRLTKEDRCDSDGFTIDVDSVSVKVVEYRKTWIQPPGSIC